MLVVTNGLLYLAGWLLCVYFAAIDMPLVSITALTTLIALHLGIVYKTDRKIFWVDLLLAVYSVVIGLFVETLFIHFQAVRYSEQACALCFPPLWLLLLYPLFASTFNHSFRYINSNLLLPLILAFFAPLSYIAANKIGACTFPSGVAYAYAVLSLGWIVILYCLTLLNRKLLSISDEIYHNNNSKPAKMLFDGECPLCSKEVDYLRKVNNKGLEFIDIADKNYRPEENQGVDYDTAMKKMHAIDPEGQILTGCDAFYEIYSKAGLNGLALLIRAPIFRNFFDLFYAIFASLRLTLTGRKPKQ